MRHFCVATITSKNGFTVLASIALAITVILATTTSARAQPTEVVLHAFTTQMNGGDPQSGVLRDAAGVLFGTTYNGGSSSYGTVYRVQTDGTEQVLHNFTAGADGAKPSGCVIADASGNLYGTTLYGGTSNAGTVYKIDSSGQESVLYAFSGARDGGSPYGGLVRDAAGNLFGTTSAGGESGNGTVYKIDSTGHETVIHSFANSPDGANPLAGLIPDDAGNLYGTTNTGGSAGAGTVFKVDAAGRETVLYSFVLEGPNSANPVAPLVRDSAGNLYGVTTTGGKSYTGGIFKIDPSGNETYLWEFIGSIDLQGAPGGLLLDDRGNLYGASSSGGIHQRGGIFRLDPSGTFTDLYDFTGEPDGSYSSGRVIADEWGNLYGTTGAGGTANLGTVFKFDPAGAETVLFSFGSSPGGNNINAGVTLDVAGNIYGTAYSGGTSGFGTVFKIDPSGRETVLHSFAGGSDGANPYAGVIGDFAGVISDTEDNLYGTTYYGGLSNSGTLYKIDSSGNETVLHSFAGGLDGANPAAGVIRDSKGNLYGTTVSGGASGLGTVFKIDPDKRETILHTFTGVDGANPYGGLIADEAGNLYGTTGSGGTSNDGVLFEIAASGQETVVFNFASIGAHPYDGVVRDAAGNFYGTTYLFSGGVLFKVDPAGQGTVLFSFFLDPVGNFPYSGVILDAAGNIFGTTYYGGIQTVGNLGNGYGVVFELNPAGQETILHTFTSGRDGAYPYAGLTQDSQGNLYGTTTGGGLGNGGTVFKILMN